MAGASGGRLTAAGASWGCKRQGAGFSCSGGAAARASGRCASAWGCTCNGPRLGGYRSGSRQGDCASACCTLGCGCGCGGMRLGACRSASSQGDGSFAEGHAPPHAGVHGNVGWPVWCWELWQGCSLGDALASSGPEGFGVAPLSSEGCMLPPQGCSGGTPGGFVDAPLGGAFQGRAPAAAFVPMPEFLALAAYAFAAASTVFAEAAATTDCGRRTGGKSFLGIGNFARFAASAPGVQEGASLGRPGPAPPRPPFDIASCNCAGGGRTVVGASFAPPMTRRHTSADKLRAASMPRCRWPANVNCMCLNIEHRPEGPCPRDKP
mmetsp:Transcript_79818/g.222213  ORF Transcript_79818/g.222213 Transcript_79818/m.222213 type:complete len:322 (+) Transcript_79818:192-1157(+)